MEVSPITSPWMEMRTSDEEYNPKDISNEEHTPYRSPKMTRAMAPKIISSDIEKDIHILLEPLALGFDPLRMECPNVKGTYHSKFSDLERKLFQYIRTIHQEHKEAFQEEREKCINKILSIDLLKSKERKRESQLGHSPPLVLNNMRNDRHYDHEQVKRFLIPFYPLFGREVSLSSIREIIAAVLCAMNLSENAEAKAQTSWSNALERCKWLIPGRDTLLSMIVEETKRMRDEFLSSVSASDEVTIMVDGTEAGKKRSKQVMIIVKHKERHMLYPVQAETEKGSDLLAVARLAATNALLHHPKLTLVTDGASSCTGKVRGLITLLNQERKGKNVDPATHIVCGSHGLDWVAKDVYIQLKKAIVQYYGVQLEKNVGDALKSEEEQSENPNASKEEQVANLSKKQTLNKAFETISRQDKDTLDDAKRGEQLLLCLHYLIFQAPNDLKNRRTWFELSSCMVEFRSDMGMNKRDTERQLHLGKLDPVLLEETVVNTDSFQEKFYGITKKGKKRKNKKKDVEEVKDKEQERLAASIPAPTKPNPTRFLYALEGAEYMALYGNAFLQGYDASKHKDLFVPKPKGRNNAIPVPKWVTALENNDARILLVLLGLGILPILRKYLHAIQSREYPGVYMAKTMRMMTKEIRVVLVKWKRKASIRLTEDEEDVDDFFDTLGLTPSTPLLNMLVGLSRDMESDDNMYSDGIKKFSLHDKLQTRLETVQDGKQMKWKEYPLTLLGLVTLEEDKKTGAVKMTRTIDKKYYNALEKDNSFLSKLSENRKEEVEFNGLSKLTNWPKNSELKRVIDPILRTPVSNVQVEGSFCYLEKMMKSRPNMNQGLLHAYAVGASLGPLTAHQVKPKKKKWRDARDRQKWIYSRKAETHCTVEKQPEVVKEKKRWSKVEREDQEVEEMTVQGGKIPQNKSQTQSKEWDQKYRRLRRAIDDAKGKVAKDAAWKAYNEHMASICKRK